MPLNAHGSSSSQSSGESSRFCGVSLPFLPELSPLVLSSALSSGFDFVCLPLAHPHALRRCRLSCFSGASLGAASSAPPAAIRSALSLPEETWATRVVGVTSAWIDVDSECNAARRDAEAALLEEIGSAVHCGITVVVVPPPPAGAWACASYARALTAAAHAHMALTLWLQVPLNPHAPDAMEWWQTVRRLSQEHPSVTAALVVGADLPEDAAEIKRWRGEHVRSVFVDADAFVANRRGYPTLPRAHQDVLAWYLDDGQARFCLFGGSSPSALSMAAAGKSISAEGVEVNAETTAVPRHPLTTHWEYMCYLCQKRPAPDAQAEAENGYRDYLQAPLQPLMDHLESSTYATFERDAAKYDAYERAVAAFLGDLAGAPVAETQRKSVRVLVAGAGRGPLVSASLRAADALNVPMQVTALEKNPYAFSGLRHRLAEDALWRDRVELVHSDMRSFDAASMASFCHSEGTYDAVVSELLGSLGDNELSPECLDGIVDRILAPGGVSIPRSYTSYIAPVSAYRAFAEARRYEDVKHMETTFVVKLHAHHLLAKPLPCHSFYHPRSVPPSPIDRCEGDVGDVRSETWRRDSGKTFPPSTWDNERTARCDFARPDAPRATCHGLAGYFDCVLYGNVSLCTLPDERHTPNMGSWFPLYIPLAQPLHVPAGADMTAHLWRRIGGGRVWYEWTVGITGVDDAPLHNLGGRSSSLGL